MVQAVFLDFDHTLYSHQIKGIPQSARDAIKALQAKGIKCVLATGRHTVELRRFPEAFTLGLDGYVTIDGQMVLDKDLNIISSCEFRGKALDDMLKVFNSKQVQTILVEQDRMYLNYKSGERDKLIASEGLLHHAVDVHTGNPVYLGVSYITPEQEPWLQGLLPECSFLRWSPFGVDITPKGRDKVSGIMDYLDHCNIPRTDWMAFGDSHNDIGMLKAAPIGIAMGNSLDSVKEIADYVTSDINEDGIWNALVRYGLI